MAALRRQPRSRHRRPRPQDLDDARRAGPAAAGRREVAVTARDYADAVAEFDRSAGGGLISRAGAEFRWTGSWVAVDLVLDLAGGTELDDRLAAELLAFLDRRRLAGYDLRLLPARDLPLQLALTVCVEPGFLAGAVGQDVAAALRPGVRADGSRGLFDPEHLSFGDPVLLSRLHLVLSAVPGVRSVTVDVLAPLDSATPDADTALVKATGQLTVGRDRIARLDDDPARPERGRLTLVTGEAADGADRRLTRRRRRGRPGPPAGEPARSEPGELPPRHVRDLPPGHARRPVAPTARLARVRVRPDRATALVDAWAYLADSASSTPNWSPTRPSSARPPSSTRCSAWPAWSATGRARAPPRGCCSPSPSTRRGRGGGHRPPGHPGGRAGRAGPAAGGVRNRSGGGRTCRAQQHPAGGRRSGRPVRPARRARGGCGADHARRAGPVRRPDGRLQPDRQRPRAGLPTPCRGPAADGAPPRTRSAADAPPDPAEQALPDATSDLRRTVHVAGTGMRLRAGGHVLVFDRFDEDGVPVGEGLLREIAEVREDRRAGLTALTWVEDGTVYATAPGTAPAVYALRETAPLRRRRPTLRRHAEAAPQGFTDWDVDPGRWLPDEAFVLHLDTVVAAAAAGNDADPASRSCSTSAAPAASTAPSV
ncbi:hypothetical protein ACFQ0M_10240 [Kitasatospora aburaviensis]